MAKHRCLRTHQTKIEGRSRGNHLEGGSWLINALHCIVHSGFTHVITQVQIEMRPACDRQHISCSRLNHDHRSTLGVKFIETPIQLFLNKSLNIHIQRKLRIKP